MDYQEIKPNGFLLNFIKSSWMYHNKDSEVRYAILPDGCFDLIAELENDKVKSITLTGVWTHPINVSIKPRTKIFAIRFKLLASEYIFKQEIGSLLDSSTPLSIDFWDLDKMDYSDFSKFAEVIFDRIGMSLKHLNKIDDRKLALFEHIYNQESSSVKALSARVIWSERQMNRYFNNQYGFPLKTFLNIVRIHSSLTDIANGELYPEKEYFDQAHFIKEVKRYTQSTPKELSRNENDRFLQLSAITKK